MTAGSSLNCGLEDGSQRTLSFYRSAALGSWLASLMKISYLRKHLYEPSVSHDKVARTIYDLRFTSQNRLNVLT